MQTVSFRCNADPEIGYGHLSRCLTLATEVKRSGMNVNFLLRSKDIVARKKVEKLNFPALLDFDVKNWPKNIVILDMAYEKVLQYPKAVDNLFIQMRKLGIISVWFDSMGEHSASMNFQESAELIVTPYLGAEADPQPRCKKWLSGAQYAIIAPDFVYTPKKKPTNQKLLLLTVGGSDPWALTEKISSLFCKLQISSWKLRVIIGPLFEKSRIERIKNDYPSIEVVEDKGSLLIDFLESDAVVSAAGLTRYEIAALRIPCLLISPSNFCSNYLNRFQEQKIANVLHLFDENFEKDLSISLTELLLVRSQITPPFLVDTMGCKRVVKVLGELISET